MFETRSHSWREVGLLMNQVDAEVVRRARRRGILFLALIVGLLLVRAHRDSIFGLDTKTPGDPSTTAVKVGVVVALLILGWAMAAELGRAVGPTFFRRMDPATAGTVGFFTRLIVMGIVILLALGEVGINTTSLTIGASFVAVVFGLAAQQTLGNVIAGIVLLSARPFRVGERVRLQAGGLAGQVEGVVSSLGLLYTAFATGEELTMVPNSVVLNCAVIPLREPDSVDLRARLRQGITPRGLQRLLENSLTTPLRDIPRITLEELDGDEVVVRILATPRHAADGPALATEVLEIVTRETRTAEERAAGDVGVDGRGAGGRGGGERPVDARAVDARAVDAQAVGDAGRGVDLEAADETVVRAPARGGADRL